MSDFYTYDKNREIIVALVHALRKNGVHETEEIQDALAWLKQDYDVIGIDKDGNWFREDGRDE